MSAVVETSGASKALAKGGGRGGSGGGGGLKVVEETVAAYAGLLNMSQRYRDEFERGGGSIGAVGVSDPKRIHGRWLRHYAEIKAARSALSDILLMPRTQVDSAMAMQMVSYLFAAIGKRKTDEENAMLLFAATEMFSPTDATIGSVTGLWKPINRHPLILALAVKKLINTAKFTSCAELREAMEEVHRKLGHQKWAMDSISEQIEEADEIMFEREREAWAAAYRNADHAVAFEMRECLWTEAPGEEDTGEAIAPTPRWSALNEIIARANGNGQE
jgi:hypothetical protein